MDIYEIRRKRMADLIKSPPFNGNQAAFAAKIDKQASYVSRCLLPLGKPHRKRIGEDMAREIERTLDLPALWMDTNGSAVAGAIKDEAALDAYGLINRALAALVIVGRRKDEIIEAIRLAERDSREARESVLLGIKEKVR